ncbi:MAG: radical SAM protein [Patescibacteria group bacterium]
MTVNSRCERACFFCRYSGEGVETPAMAELDIRTVLTVVKICESFGVSYVKLTGGDPALWQPLVDCVRVIKEQTACRVEVISRHPKIAAYAHLLAQAGVDMLNISIDTLDPTLHRKITGVNDLDGILDALKACVNTGVSCKVNMVVLAGINDHEIDALISFSDSLGVKVVKLLDLMTDIEDGTETFVQRMHLLGFGSLREVYLPLQSIASRLKKRAVGERRFLQLGGLGNPMLSFTMPSGMDVVIKDHHAGAWYGSICKGCKYYPCSSALMALRLTADMRLQYCLFREDLCIDIKLIKAKSLCNIIADVLQVYDQAIFHACPE